VKSVSNLPTLKIQFRLGFLEDAILPLASWSFGIFWAYYYWRCCFQLSVGLVSLFWGGFFFYFCGFKNTFFSTLDMQVSHQAFTPFFTIHPKSLISQREH